MDRILSIGVPLSAVARAGTVRAARPGVPDRRVHEYLELLSFFFRQSDTLFFFRVRSSTMSDDELERFFARGSDSKIRNDLLLYATPNDIKFSGVRVGRDRTATAVITSVENIRNVLTGATYGRIELSQLFRVVIPDITLRWPVDVSPVKLAACLVEWLSARQEPVQTDHDLCTLAARVGVSLNAMENFKFIRPEPGPIAQMLLTRRRQYQREGARGAWRGKTGSASVSWDIFPKSHGVTATIRSVPGGDWWPTARDEYSHETPMPRPVQDQAIHRAGNISTVLGSRRFYLNDVVEYLACYSGAANGHVRGAKWEKDVDQQMIDDLRSIYLPRIRQGVSWNKIETEVIGNLEPSDSYEALKQLCGGKSSALLQQAAALGSSFHKTITHLLTRENTALLRLHPAQCGFLGVPSVHTSNSEVERERLARETASALSALAPHEAYVPIVQMAQLCVDEVAQYVNNVLPRASQFAYEFTEFPVYFPHLVHQTSGKVYETQVDGICTYWAPPCTDRDGPIQERIGILEYKSVYGDITMGDPLPRKEAVLQAILNAYMFEENTGLQVDRVFLVYVTRYNRISIFDYAYDPPSVEWQSDAIWTWFTKHSPNHLYVDYGHIGYARQIAENRALWGPEHMELDKRLTVRNWAPNRMRAPPGYRADGPDRGFRVDGVDIPVGRLVKHQAGATDIEYLRRPPRATIIIQQLDSLDFRGNTGHPTGVVQGELYRGTVNGATAMKISRKILAPPPGEGDVAGRRRLLQRVSGFVRTLGDLTDVDGILLTAALSRRLGYTKITDENSNQQLIIRGIRRAINRRLLLQSGATEEELHTLPHNMFPRLLTKGAMAKLNILFDDSVKDAVKDAIEAVRLSKL